jgi:hypothetical protein
MILQRAGEMTIDPLAGFFGVKGLVTYMLYPLPTDDHHRGKSHRGFFLLPKQERKDEEKKSRTDDEGYLSWF